MMDFIKRTSPRNVNVNKNTVDFACRFSGRQFFVQFSFIRYKPDTLPC